MNYIQTTKDLLEVELKMEGTNYEDLLDVYALLVFVRGEKCTNKNVHDAWSIWQDNSMPNHKSLIPFEKLTKEVQDLDSEYRDAIIKVSKMLNIKE